MLELTRSLESAVEQGIFPGAVALVGQAGHILWHEARGHAALVPQPRPLSRDTLFDIASLTKPVAGATAVMLLSEAGELSVSEKVSRFIPEFAQRGKDDVTIRHLMTHASGLPAWLPLYQIVGPPDPGEQPSGVPGEASAGAHPAQQVFRHLHAIGPEYAPGTRSVYSDLGFIVLGEVIERVAGMPLDRFVGERVFGPLGMASTLFNRGNGASAFPPEAFAATELSPQRGGVLCGEVHDENAYFMGGVAGHAGVFSTARDLSVFVQALLGALAGESAFLSSDTVNRFVTRADLVPGSSRALGWDTPSVPSSSGNRFSERSFGHTGFTGTSIWVDPERRLYVILLTNRVHPSRDNTRIAQFRPRFHDLVMAQVLGIETSLPTRRKTMTPLQLAGTAFVVGLSGAMMPGPVLTVAITQTPRHGWITGLLISLGHGVVELALVAALYLGASRFIARSAFSHVVGLAGGVILVWMGCRMVVGAVRGTLGLDLDPKRRPGRTSGPAVLGGLTTLSNPYWYLWWATVGMAYMVQAMRHGYVGVVFFFSGHLMADVAWYSLVSVIVVLGKRAMNNTVYRGLLIVCGVFLVALGAYFVGYGFTR